MVSETIKVADECWVALALLTRENARRNSFSSKEILARVRRENAHATLRPGVPAHIHLHNVANLEPNTARYRMFYRESDGTYRLYRPGDDHHPERTGKILPRRDELPVTYHDLLDWYERDYCTGAITHIPSDDPILRIIGLGKDLWAGIDPDRFVDELRSGWGEFSDLQADRQSGDVWERVVKYQGDQFHTITGLPFTYEVEGSSGIWFYRQGSRINRRLAKSELESALRKCPLHSTADLKEFQDPSYLYGLLTDARITGRG